MPGRKPIRPGRVSEQFRADAEKYGAETGLLIASPVGTKPRPNPDRRVSSRLLYGFLGVMIAPVLIGLPWLDMPSSFGGMSIAHIVVLSAALSVLLLLPCLVAVWSTQARPLQKRRGYTDDSESTDAGPDRPRGAPPGPPTLPETPDDSALLFPVYVLVDESADMAPYLTTLSSGLLEFVSTITADSDLAHRLRLSIIGFGTGSTELLALTEVSRNTIPGDPRAHGALDYTVVLEILRKRVPRDRATLLGTGYRVAPPLVYFLLGEPPHQAAWYALYARLREEFAASFTTLHLRSPGTEGRHLHDGPGSLIAARGERFVRRILSRHPSEIRVRRRVGDAE